MSEGTVIHDLMKFRMKCDTCGFFEAWGETEQEAHDVHNAGRDPIHTFDDTQTAVVDQVVQEAPKMRDGRPIVRADTRPINFMTYFSMVGDSPTGIGDGKACRWDFSNSDDIYEGVDANIPSGYKCKQLFLQFNCPVYLKDGTIYFFDVPWGCYATMDIVVPPGNYYPNSKGEIPAALLGVPGDGMYANSGADYVSFQVYVPRQYMHGSCPMGDELNAEGAAIDALPVGWILRNRIYTPIADIISRGYGSFEMYRCHTALLPGQTIADIQSEH